MNVLQNWCQSHHLRNILKVKTKGTSRTWQVLEYWVLRQGQKETEMITSWNPLKSCHWTVFKRKIVPSTGHRALEGVSQLKRNRSQNYTGYAPSNSFSKDNEKSVSTTEERKAFHNWFRRRELNFCTWSRLFSFWLQNCLFLCHARMSFCHDIVLCTKWDAKAFPVPLF